MKAGSSCCKLHAKASEEVEEVTLSHNDAGAAFLSELVDVSTSHFHKDGYQLLTGFDSV